MFILLFLYNWIPREKGPDHAINGDVPTPATMTSLLLLLYRHDDLYYGVTSPSTMTSLTPLL